MGAKDTKKGGFGLKSRDKQDLKRTESEGKASAPAVPAAGMTANVPWETNLLEVYGKTVALSHPRLEPGAVSMEYGLSPSIIPLQEGVTIKPGRAFGQVAGFIDGNTGTEGVIFNAAGGEVEFAPPNLKDVKVTGELAVATIVAAGAPVAD